MAGDQNPSGVDFAAQLASRHPNEDWIAAIGKGALMSRGDVMAYLDSNAPVPDAFIKAAREMESLLDAGDPESGEHVFNAETNADVALMEIDAEPGLTVLPGAKGAPSRSGSPHEMGEKPDTLGAGEET